MGEARALSLWMEALVEELNGVLFLVLGGGGVFALPPQPGPELGGGILRSCLPRIEGIFVERVVRLAGALLPALCTIAPLPASARREDEGPLIALPKPAKIGGGA